MAESGIGDSLVQKKKADSTEVEPAFARVCEAESYFVKGSGLSWKCTTLLVLPLPPSMCCTARVE